MAGTTSHPTRGAWIEIRPSSSTSLRMAGRTPHGVRGLKSYLSAHQAPGGAVAPHTGCVD